MNYLRCCLILCCAVLAGCAVPRVEVPRLTPSILGTQTEDQRIPIRAFSIESSDRPFEIKSDMRFMSGDSRGVLFPKQAREFLSQDLRDYVAARFRIDASADAILLMKLEQAHSYFTMHQSGANWIPFVGVITSIADGFQQVPITFIVELKADVSNANLTIPEVNVFVKRSQAVTGWGSTVEKHREIYRGQIDHVRTELFERLDAQLITLWKDGKLLAQQQQSPVSNAASLASELAKLDSALADEKLSKDEYEKLIVAMKAKYSARVVAPATPLETIGSRSPTTNNPSMLVEGAKAATVIATNSPDKMKFDVAKAEQPTQPFSEPIAQSTEKNNISATAIATAAAKAAEGEPAAVVAKESATASTPKAATGASSSPNSGVNKTEKISHPKSMGLKVYLLSNEIWVSSVAPKSAAHVAGIREGDRVVAFSGERNQVDKFPLLRKINAASLDQQGAVEITWQRQSSSQMQTNTLEWRAN